MRKLILPLLLLCSLFANSQIDYFTIEKDNGSLFGCAEHLAPANPFGHKEGWIIWLHGIDANRTAPFSINDTTRISAVTTKGPLYFVGSAPLPLFQKPGGSATDLYRWNVIAPQNSTGQWDGERVIKTIAHIRSEHADTDTSLIVLVGYSLGGGGVQSCLNLSGVRQYVKYAVVIAPGYNSTPNYPLITAEAINIDVFATIADELVPESVPDGWVNGLKANNPIAIPNYYRFVDVTTTHPTTNPEHDYIEVLIARDTTNGDTELMTNGSTWTKTENIYQRGLRFKGPRRKRN
jgi:hypothetical protein